ncbi:rhomboid family intramembrane serine protease [Crocinitomix catalasitica]|uniref:rhomboid family intramembrane serine protease n=1 Tax=Crocinitomix catalasitica TaxID=184607 RepID=UPI00068696D1|nr:rhomboid family intramembrane serine protease [Crocinitomix catalasitica]
MFNSKVTRISFTIALSVLTIMWLVFILDYSLGLKLYKYGVYPQRNSGLIGIITAPFIHSTKDFSHIFSNSGPIFILTWLLFYHYRDIATRAFVSIFLLTGISLWFLGRENYHVGMSGVIYGLTAFLVFSGFFRKNMRVAGISLFVIFIYGSMVWGVLPWKEQVSWEGHLLGLFSGLIMAVLLKSIGPQPEKLRYEIEEELGIEPELEYWKEDFVPPTTIDPDSGIETPVYVYRFVPKPPPTENKEPKND